MARPGALSAPLSSTAVPIGAGLLFQLMPVSVQVLSASEIGGPLEVLLFTIRRSVAELIGPFTTPTVNFRKLSCCGLVSTDRSTAVPKFLVGRVPSTYASASGTSVRLVVGTGVGVAVGGVVAVAVAVAVGVGVSVPGTGVSVGVFVGVLVGIGVTVGVSVGSGVAVEVAVGTAVGKLEL